MIEIQEKKQLLLEKLYAPYRQCVQCPLGFLGRTNVVLGHGNPDARLMFIGEAPGAQEDIQGKPFVGKSGALLNKIFEWTNIARQEVFITNIVKCRPPGNRRPITNEMQTCKKLLLMEQIRIINPTIVCTLGSAALAGLIEIELKITQVHGKIMNLGSLNVLPTYHPAYILRNPKELQAMIHDIGLAKSLAYPSNSPLHT